MRSPESVKGKLFQADFLYHNSPPDKEPFGTFPFTEGCSQAVGLGFFIWSKLCGLLS